jgi:hypothetical protein
MNRAVLLLMLVTMAAGDWAVDTALAQVEGLASRIGGQGDAGYANVRQAPYSGIGDGKADDTKAFQKALDDVGAAGGGIVFVPTGIYLIATHLTVPGGTALVGVGRAPETYSPKAPGSTLLALEGAGSREGTPFITLLGPDSTLEGITVFYPNQIVSEKPVPYPWTVRGGGGGENVSIINVLLTNPYQGVDFATNSTARHFVRGLYGQPLFKGIWVDQCYDIGRIQDVHFWPFWSQDKRIVDFTTTNGTAYIFQRTDWEVVEDIFCWGYHVGIEFSASTKGGMNGQMTDIDLDNVDIGLDVNATQPYAVHISNLNIANAGAGTEHVAIWGRKSSQAAELSVRGASFWGFIKQVLRWENPGTVSLSDARLIPWNIQRPMMELLAGGALIHDNFFQPYRQEHIEDYWYHDPLRATGNGTAVRIGPGVNNVMFHNNQLNGNRIVNESERGVSLANNQP